MTWRGCGGRVPRGLNTADARRPHRSSSMGDVCDLRPSQTHNKRPVINAGGRGVTRDLDVPHKRPHLNGKGSTGIHRKMDRGDLNRPLLDWLVALSGRLRRVRVICGDWARVLTPSCTWKVGGGTLTGVLLDPPYSHHVRDRMLYAIDQDIAAKVRAWALREGDNPIMRIALCGLDGEHTMPAAWQAAYWKAPRGYAKETRREVIWFSPHCIRARSLFDEREFEQPQFAEAAAR